MTKLKVKSTPTQEVTQGQGEQSLVMSRKTLVVENPTKIQVDTGAMCEPIPINQLGDYCEGEDGNTTLLIEFKEVKSIAILDNGIATKNVWENWVKPTLRKTRMKLQLIDGLLESPLGFLEKIIVISCGIEYKHSFATIDFG